MKLESAQDLQKINIKFHENPSSESRIFPWGQTDRHDVANSCFSHLKTMNHDLGHKKEAYFKRLFFSPLGSAMQMQDKEKQD